MKLFALTLGILLAFCTLLIYVPKIRIVKANGTIYIRADGSVEGMDKIQRDGDVYTFTDNINDSIVVERSNIIIDGNGYTLQGTGADPYRGIDLTGRSNVTITSMEIKAFYYGICLSESSSNIISDNNITNNEVGMHLSRSTNNKIYKNKITENKFDGISLVLCSGNTISENNITETAHCGIDFITSSNNIILENKIADNEYGIHLSHSSNNNTVSGNYIIENNRIHTPHASPFGIQLPHESSNNKIFHNNFMRNIYHVSIVGVLGNLWDNGVEGNYWDGYYRNDTDHDGIGDSWCKIADDNIDHYPLMGMFHSFNTALGYDVDVMSNSTIEDFEYFESNSTIRMYVSNMTTGQTFGFCRLCIPHTLMNSDGISVIIDDGQTPVLHNNYTLHDNDTHRWIYFAYEHSTHKVVIIPEFLSLVILPIFMMATTLLVVIIHKKG